MISDLKSDDTFPPELRPSKIMTHEQRRSVFSLTGNISLDILDDHDQIEAKNEEAENSEEEDTEIDENGTSTSSRSSCESLNTKKAAKITENINLIQIEEKDEVEKRSITPIIIVQTGTPDKQQKNKDNSNNILENSKKMSSNSNPNTKTTTERKLGDIDNLSSDTDTDMMLHGQHQIEGLEFDDELDNTATSFTGENTSILATPSHINNSKNQSQNPTEAALLEENYLLEIQTLKNLNIPNTNEVYDIAGYLGSILEPLNQELGQDSNNSHKYNLSGLTEQITKVLDLLDTTSATARDLQNKLFDSLQNNFDLKKKFSEQQNQFEASELEYHSTINHLSDQLLEVQNEMNSGKMENDWDFEVSNVSQVEENLAAALRDAQDKIDKLKKARLMGGRKENNINGNDNKEEEDQSNSNEQQQEAEKQKNLEDLSNIISQKNYYKEKCFELEDKIRELSGIRHETLLENKPSRADSSISSKSGSKINDTINSNNTNHHTPSNASFSKNNSLFRGATLLGGSDSNASGSLKQSVSGFLSRFKRDLSKDESNDGGH